MPPVDFDGSSLVSKRPDPSRFEESRGVSFEIDEALRHSDRTGAEETKGAGTITQEVSSSPIPDSLEKTREEAQQRVALLAKRYVFGAELGPEASARLSILQERVRKAFPRVTEQDFLDLEFHNRELNERAEKAAAILRELGV